MTSSVGCRSVRNPVCSGLVPGEERVTGRNGMFETWSWPPGQWPPVSFLRRPHAVPCRSSAIRKVPQS